MAIFNLSIKLSFVKSKKTLFVGALLGIVSLTIAGMLIFLYQFRHSIYPNVYIDSVAVGGLTKEQALEKINSSENNLPTHILQLTVDDIAIASNSSQLGATKNYKKALSAAYDVGRMGGIDKRFRVLLNLLIKPSYVSAQIQYDLDKLLGAITQLKEQVDIQGSHPSAKLTYSNSPLSLSIDPGKNGRELEIEPSLDLILNVLNNGNEMLGMENLEGENGKTIPMIKVKALVASTSAQLSPEEIDLAKIRAEKFVGKEVIFIRNDDKNNDVFVKFNDQEMISLLSFPDGYSEDNLSDLLTEWEEKIARPPQNAEFEYDPETLEVEKFVPHKDGLTLDAQKTGKQIIEWLSGVENSEPEPNANETDRNSDEIPSQLPLALVSQTPLITLAETNDLGIVERIGFGDSYYDHSIPGRIYNVALATERISLTIVPPGEEFSFNKTLGEVSRKTGYRPAYVIKGGTTILGDGGGVCQVSTTTFRSLLDAGLNITKRKPHSYRVGYYEQNSLPGIDATVYSGDVDLRFINDTDHHVLLYGETNSDNLYMKIEIYGTSDGRTTEIVEYKQWEARPPLATQYIPSTDLPTGKLRQIDWSAPGLKTSFVNVVKDVEGNIISEDKYSSNYRPWAAKYLRGV